MNTFDETRQHDNLEARLVGQNLSISLSVDSCLGQQVCAVASGYWGQLSNHGIRFFPMWLIPELPAHPEAGNVYLAAEVNLIAESLFEKRSNVVNRVVPFVFGSSEPSSSIQLQRKIN